MTTHQNQVRHFRVDSDREKRCYEAAEVQGINLAGVPQIEDPGLQPVSRHSGDRRDPAPVDEEAATRAIAAACREMQRRKGIRIEREYR